MTAVGVFLCVVGVFLCRMGDAMEFHGDKWAEVAGYGGAILVLVGGALTLTGVGVWLWRVMP